MTKRDLGCPSCERCEDLLDDMQAAFEARKDIPARMVVVVHHDGCTRTRMDTDDLIVQEKVLSQMLTLVRARIMMAAVEAERQAARAYKRKADKDSN